MALKSSYKKKYFENYDVLTSTKITNPNGSTRKDVNDDKLIYNLARAKRVLKEIVRLNLTPYSSFLTLTYAENMQDYKQFYIDFKIFIKKLRRDGYTVTYAGVKELQQRGAIHAHIVLFNDLRHVDFAKYWPNGFVYLKEINNYDVATDDVIVNYLVKYLINMSKGQMISLDKRLFFTSRDVIRPKVDVIDVFEYKTNVNGNLVINDGLTQKIVIKKI